MQSSSGGSKPPQNIQNINIIYQENSNEQINVETENLNSSQDENIKVNKKNENKQKTQFLYQYTDTGPYEIYMQAKNGKNIGNYNFLQIAKYIYNQNIHEIKRLHKKGKNRISVEFSNYKHANEFVKNKKIEDDGYELFIPSKNVTSKAIVNYVDTSFTDEELKKYTVIKIENSKVLNVRRMNRRVEGEDGKIEYKPTGTVCYTFTGKQFPKEVYICGIPFRTKTYLMPVTQCYNCYLYGHTQGQCKGKKKCSKCGEEKHEGDCTTKCYHCKSNEHQSRNKKCQEYIRQSEIKKLMSYENLSYYEANEKIPPIPSKTKATEIHIQRKEFPPLSQTTNAETITVNQRREYTKENKKTYSSQVKTQKRRKTYEEFDKEEHNNLLIRPNGRERREENESESEESIEYQQNKTDRKKEMDQQMMEEISRLLTEFSTEQKEEIINHLTQLKYKLDTSSQTHNQNTYGRRPHHSSMEH